MNKIERIEALEAEIKKLKQELREPEFEVGKWYSKIEDGTKYILYLTKIDGIKHYGYGMIGNNWETEKPYPFTTNIKTYKPATESEVFEALKKEAIKKAGDKTIKCLHGSTNAKISEISHFELSKVDGCLRYFLKKGGCGCVFDPDKKPMWAEIIDEPFKVCGYEVKRDENVFLIGCKTIHEKELIRVRNIMVFNKFKSVQFDEYKVTLEEINKILEL